MHFIPQGLRSVGPHVVEKLCEVVKLRNKLAKANGFEDFYGAHLYALHSLKSSFDVCWDARSS